MPRWPRGRPSGSRPWPASFLFGRQLRASASLPDAISSARRLQTSSARLRNGLTGRNNSSRRGSLASVLDGCCLVIVQVANTTRTAIQTAAVFWEEMSAAIGSLGHEGNNASEPREDCVNRRDLIKLSAGLGVVAGIGVGESRTAKAQSKVVLKASDVHPSGYPTVVATESFGKKLSDTTNGRISVQMFPSMTLGGEKETIEQTQLGAIQLLRVSVGALGPVVDDLNVLNIPFLCRDTAHMQNVLDGAIGQELLDKVTNNAKCQSGRFMLDGCGGSQLLQHQASHKVFGRYEGPEISRHRKSDVRRYGQCARREWRRDGYDQVFSSLQTGVIDGAENNPPSYVFDNHYTVAKYFT